MMQRAQPARTVGTKRMKTTLLVIAVLLALAGCGDPGGTSERERVRGTVEQYFHAAAFGDGETACHFLTEQARHGFGGLLDGPAARDCETNVRKVARISLPLHAISVSWIVMNDDRSTAYVTSTRPPYSNTVELRRVGRSWKLLYLPTAIRRFQRPRVTRDSHRHE
jgi:hypothetical protein